MIKVGIIGGTGYTGVELLRLPAQHPQTVSMAERESEGNGGGTGLRYPEVRQESGHAGASRGAITAQKGCANAVTAFAKRKDTLYTLRMIKGFRHKGLEKFFKTGSRAGIQAGHASRLRIQLTALAHATRPGDMNAPGWRLHRLSGDRAGFYAVSVSGNWRLMFRFDGQDAVDVEYLDYH